MGLLDNIDKELERIEQVRESQEIFKHTKVKRLKINKLTRKGYFEDKSKARSNITFKKLVKNIRNSIRKYRRCPKKYAVYIKSNWWVRRKNKYFQNHPRKCRKCGTSNFIIVHHAVYGNLGNEKDEHLFTLCKTHHNEFHSIYSIKKNMLKETLEFIRSSLATLESY